MNTIRNIGNSPYPVKSQKAKLATRTNGNKIHNYGSDTFRKSSISDANLLPSSIKSHSTKGKGIPKEIIGVGIMVGGVIASSLLTPTIGSGLSAIMAVSSMLIGTIIARS